MLVEAQADQPGPCKSPALDHVCKTMERGREWDLCVTIDQLNKSFSQGGSMLNRVCYVSTSRNPFTNRLIIFCNLGQECTLVNLEAIFKCHKAYRSKPKSHVSPLHLCPLITFPCSQLHVCSPLVALLSHFFHPYP